MTMPPAFYVRDGEQLLATELTRGPWSSDLQHGGPPAALLAGAIEQAGPDAERFLVARLTFEFLRPVPLAAFTMRTEVTRAGNKAQRIDAELVCGGQVSVRAHALRIRRAQVPLPSPRCPRHSAPRGPAGLEPWVFPFFRDRIAYHCGVEVRISKGVWGKGPTAAWMRLLAPLVAGEPTSPLQALVTLADAGNGVCPVLDTREFSFVNPDLTLHLDRPPCGEWFALDARSTVDPLGIGLAQSELHDRDGELGRALQCLVVETRAGAGADEGEAPTMKTP
ncbi:MAG: thioesterase family protein [Deltaproteobacteria bacterium]|nr:thioesterase family protein [Nannocystaceae bacterium]